MMSRGGKIRIGCETSDCHLTPILFAIDDQHQNGPALPRLPIILRNELGLKSTVRSTLNGFERMLASILNYRARARSNSRCGHCFILKPEIDRRNGDLVFQSEFTMKYDGPRFAPNFIRC